MGNHPIDYELVKGCSKCGNVSLKSNFHTDKKMIYTQAVKHV